MIALLALLLAGPALALDPWTDEALAEVLGPEPARAPDAAGDCDRTLAVQAGDAVDCRGLLVPPQGYAHLLAREAWLDGALLLAQAAAADAAAAAQEQHESAVAWREQARSRQGCGPVCVGAVAGGGVVVGAGLAVAVVYAVLPAAQALRE